MRIELWRLHSQASRYALHRTANRCISVQLALLSSTSSAGGSQMGVLPLANRFLIVSDGTIRAGHPGLDREAQLQRALPGFRTTKTRCKRGSPAGLGRRFTGAYGSAWANRTAFLELRPSLLTS